MRDDQVQQGDVIGRRIETLPGSVTQVQPSRRGLVIAAGEVTGHAHRIESLDGVKLYQGPDGLRVLEVSEAAPMTHEEHDTVTWPPGIWEIGTVREKDWTAETVREVRD